MIQDRGYSASRPLAQHRRCGVCDLGMERFV